MGRDFQGECHAGLGLRSPPSLQPSMYTLLLLVLGSSPKISVTVIPASCKENTIFRVPITRATSQL